MHPRNVFKTPPDYTELAIKYPDFRRICRLELNGKVSVDYKLETTLRTLTQTLCLEYFQLKIEFAPNSLVPTLPLRLNYILWVEDLIALLRSNVSTIYGIDIGCGSSCIYSLLSARKNQWHMVALETDEINIEYAQRNISENNLQTLITLHHQSTNDHIFREFFQQQDTNNDHANNINDATDDALDDVNNDSVNQIYDFCICNPPFYDSSINSMNSSRIRNPQKRPPPRNCPTGKLDELSCEGGEVKFIETIMDESLLYKNKIKIFTSMLGHKSSLLKIISLLEKRNIHNFCKTEFHQGKTTRWGIAWTFLTNINLIQEIKSPSLSHNCN